jgi:hypothetical protein
MADLHWNQVGDVIGVLDYLSTRTRCWSSLKTSQVRDHLAERVARASLGGTVKVFLIVLFTVSGHGDQEFSRSEEMMNLPACWKAAAVEAERLLDQSETIGMQILRIGCEVQLGSPV